MLKKSAQAVAVIAVAVAVVLKLMVHAPANTSNARLINLAAQTRVNLPDHVLGHPCLYYPNFISQEVAAQVTQRASERRVLDASCNPRVSAGASDEAAEDFPHQCRRWREGNH